MNTYTVESVEPGPRPYEANGPKLSYRVRFKELAEVVEWGKKDTSPPPTPGQVVEGTLDHSKPQFPPKFRQHWAGGGVTTSTVPTASSPVDRDPTLLIDTRGHAIQRQHSQEMALRFVSIHPSASRAMMEKSGTDSLDTVIKPVIDWFQRDIEAGVKLAAADWETKQSYGERKEEMKQPSYGERKDTQQTGVSDVPTPNLADFAQQHGAPVDTDDLPF
jgi:hypothetical protein